MLHQHTLTFEAELVGAELDVLTDRASALARAGVAWPAMPRLWLVLLLSIQPIAAHSDGGLDSRAWMVEAASKQEVRRGHL